MKKETVEVIDSELNYQKYKYPDDRDLSLNKALLIMEECLSKARHCWYSNDKNQCLRELLKTVASGVNCLEQYDVEKRNIV
jgi:hypothetical protein